jgi:hypothetical protein
MLIPVSGRLLGAYYDREDRFPTRPKQHELGPITFKFVNAARKNAVRDAKVVESVSENEVSQDRATSSNHGNGDYRDYYSRKRQC